MKLKEECDRLNLGIDFEFTAPNTPQQNGIVEQKFATLYGRGRALLNKAGFNRTMRKGLWAEAARIATLLDSSLGKPSVPTSYSMVTYQNGQDTSKPLEKSALSSLQLPFKVSWKTKDTLCLCWLSTA